MCSCSCAGGTQPASFPRCFRRSILLWQGQLNSMVVLNYFSILVLTAAGHVSDLIVRWLAATLAWSRGELWPGSCCAEQQAPGVRPRTHTARAPLKYESPCICRGSRKSPLPRDHPSRRQEMARAWQQLRATAIHAKDNPQFMCLVYSKHDLLDAKFAFRPIQ